MAAMCSESKPWTLRDASILRDASACRARARVELVRPYQPSVCRSEELVGVRDSLLSPEATR